MWPLTVGCVLIILTSHLLTKAIISNQKIGMAFCDTRVSLQVKTYLQSSSTGSTSSTSGTRSTSSSKVVAVAIVILVVVVVTVLLSNYPVKRSNVNLSPTTGPCTEGALSQYLMSSVSLFHQPPTTNHQKEQYISIVFWSFVAYCAQLLATTNHASLQTNIN